MAKKAITYGKTTTTTLKTTGVYDGETLTITDEEGTVRNVKTLFSDFTGAVIELQAKIKTDEELDVPESE